jgi:protein TonB
MVPPPINKKSDMAGAWTVAAAGDATLSGPIRVSSGTIASLAISQPQPIYPPITKDDHVAGTIILHALISKQGDIEDLSVISGSPKIVPATLDAVRMWKYKPYLLHGLPVEVETTITLNVSFVGN